MAVVKTVACPVLKRDLWLRSRTQDINVYEDTFIKMYHVPPHIIEPQNILDLGSNIGMTVAHYEMLWPKAEIFGLEMDRENVALSYKNTLHSVIGHGAVSTKTGYRYYKKSV